MGASTSIRIRPMTERDVALGMHLKEQAGWNQVERDWHRFLAMQPDGCFVAEWDGRPVATTVTCIFGQVAWIAMVLVDQAMRGRGIATALMHRAIDYLEQHRVRTIRLDATPLGQPVYERLGFEPEYTLTRYEGVVTHGSQAVLAGRVGFRHASMDDLSGILYLDQQVIGADRSKFLTRLFAERPEHAWVGIAGGWVAGYVMARAGNNALQIGPCVADEDVGQDLLARIFRAHVGWRVFLDIPLGHERSLAFARQRGFISQRELVRMVRGRQQSEDKSRLWLSSGPELG